MGNFHQRNSYCFSDIFPVVFQRKRNQLKKCCGTDRTSDFSIASGSGMGYQRFSACDSWAGSFECNRNSIISGVDYTSDTYGDPDENTGAYYEDAAKFADDYQELRNRSKRGETGYSLGKKKKFRTVKGNFGGGAKAIFYRQLLEYKKERFFIFDSMTLICVVLAGVLAKMMEPPKEGMQGLVMMGLIAYMSFCASGYAGKWDKELENPYLYLIPDTAVRKMWNATKMEHIKAFFDGLLMAGMIGYFWHVPFWQIAASIVIYVLLQANKMYLKVFAKMLLGNTMGNTGRTILRLLIQSAVLGVGVLISVAAAIFLNPEVVFAVMLVYSLAATVIVALFASMKFEVLEQNE